MILIDIDWYWLMFDWCLIDVWMMFDCYDCYWLTLTEIDWHWLTLTDFDWHWLTLIDWLIDGLVDWLTDWLIDWLIDWTILGTPYWMAPEVAAVERKEKILSI